MCHGIWNIGGLFKRMHIPSTPLIIGFILGGMAETNLRRALQASDGDLTVFVTSPISLAFLVIAVVSLFMTLRKSYKKSKAQ